MVKQVIKGAAIVGAGVVGLGVGRNIVDPLVLKVLPSNFLSGWPRLSQFVRDGQIFLTATASAVVATMIAGKFLGKAGPKVEAAAK